ncbi:HNH endonuclease [Fictibacillus phosphorivorans]|uniref:HNH endonuclease n=1 Tax=Fictibacillus phosphorivorans TaxID=1221500 RepID=UPI001292D800|nr:HNH endonuclease signature motif containing protein [Fictibacillus phosphorivorans]MQR96708.1 HNH endonuclease [Fictibacillus phosphorivorans]
MRLKEEHLALTSGIGLAGFAVSHFSEAGRSAMEEFKDEIFQCIVKPTRTTAVHYYLGYLQNISEEISQLRDAGMENEYTYSFIQRTLDGVGLKPELTEPVFDSCAGNEYGHDDDCSCGLELKKWKDFVEGNSVEIDKLIVHSAFQVIFRDRVFLHDFNLELSMFIEDYIEDIKEEKPEYVTSKNRIKRSSFPEWLKNAVFYRDMGTCSNPDCRCDLTKLIRTVTNKHIDHIVPLKLFGSNDASNFQLMCEPCNTSKGARSTATSSVNVPFWNLD